MRHLLLFLSLFLSLACMHVNAEVHRVVNVSEAGQLETILGDSANDITRITISGNLNDDDIFKLRDLTYLGELTDIDMSQANIEGNRLPDNAFYNKEYFFAKKPYSGYYYYTTKLRSIILPSNLTQIGKDSFYYANDLEEVVLPDGIVNIPDGCFNFCENLKNFKLPLSVESIGINAFGGCTSLGENMIFHEGITEIKDGAFAACNFTFIVFPSTLEVLGQYSFTDYEHALRGISCKAKIPPVYHRFSTGANWTEKDASPFGSYARNMYTSKLYIPRGTFDLYNDTKYPNHAWNMKFVIYVKDSSSKPECGIIETDIFPTSAEEMPMSGIENVRVDEAIDNNLYDITGRKVAEPVKGGLYIRGGKKIVY